MATFKNKAISSGTFTFKDKRISFNDFLETEDKELIDFLNSNPNWTLAEILKKEQCARELNFELNIALNQLEDAKTQAALAMQEAKADISKIEVELAAKLAEIKAAKIDAEARLEALATISESRIKTAQEKADLIKANAELKFKEEIKANAFFKAENEAKAIKTQKTKNQEDAEILENAKTKAKADKIAKLEAEALKS